MKKLLVILCALALSLSFANAQMGPGPGDGSGTMDGSGPRDGMGGMWAAITDLAEGNTEIQALLTVVSDNREIFRQARIDNPDMTIQELHNLNPDAFDELKVAVEEIRTWYREVRPDRPDPVMTGDMLRRRLRFRTNSDGISQTQRRLRELKQSDPDNPECDQLREQLGNLLGERKQLLREQRRGEGGPGGEGDGNHRGG